MNIPWVIISSNYAFDYRALSADRWHTYELTSKGEMKSITPLDLSKKYMKILAEEKRQMKALGLKMPK